MRVPSRPNSTGPWCPWSRGQADPAGVHQADERDEQADPDADRDLELRRTAWNTAVRKLVSTSTRTTSSSTTRPIASAQLIPEAMEKATNAFRPSPVASASG